MDTREDSLLIDRSIIRLTPSITFMRNHFYTNSFVDLDYRCTRIDLRPFPKIETTPPFASILTANPSWKIIATFPLGFELILARYFTQFHTKKIPPIVHSHFPSRINTRASDPSISSSWTTNTSRPLSAFLRERTKARPFPSSSSSPSPLPRTMASIVYLEIEAACNESSLEIVDDAPSKSGCAGIKRRHCLLPPSRPVRLERHLAEEVEDRLVRCLSTSRYSARFHGSRAETSDPSPRQWRGRGLFTTRWNGFLNLPPLRTRRRDSFDFVRFALTNPLHSYLMFKKVVDIRNENIFLGIYIYCKL